MINYEVPLLFKEYEDKIKPTIRKCNEISFTIEKTKPWESKLGGVPYLESKDDYALDNNGKPMMFIAQINLEETIELKDIFGEKGLLQFYVCNDDMYGLEDSCIVKYIENYIKDEDKLLSVNPYEEEYKDNLPFERDGKMNFELRQMPVSCACEAFEKVFSNVKFNNEQDDKLWDEFDAAGCRIGGYPYFTQYDPREYGENDILLFQLDVDDTCDIMFGDSGVANFFIEEKDLKNKDFSNVFYTWDCC